MENKQLIKKYALSLYEIGKNEGVLDEIKSGIKTLDSLQKESSVFRYFLLTKKISEKNKKLILSDIFKKQISPHLLELIFLIIDKGDTNFLSAIINRFFIVLSNQADIVPVRIITSNKLDYEANQALVSKIESKLSRKINAKNEVDPKIIGGVKFMIGNKVIDGSVSHQLRKIKNALEQV